ncbi:MAG: CotH kinase family protein, partial [Phycisphaerales bacterium]
IYYVVMTQGESDELSDIGDRSYQGTLFASEAMSNAQMNATFISVGGVDTSVHYSVGVRNRGNRSRADPPMSYRVNFPNDDPWKGMTALNLNSKYPHLQLMGSVLFRMSGLAAADATIVQLRVNGQDPTERDYNRTYGSYVALEDLDSEWARNHFRDDADGNVYRCTYFDDGVHSRTFADLDYKESPGQTPDPDDYRDNYPKKTHRAANDYSDLFALIDKLNNDGIPDSNFVAEVSEVLNLEKWMRYLAADALVGNREGGLTSGAGDDYALYRGVVDPRFWLAPHDLDTVLGQGDHSYEPERNIFVYAGVDGLERLLGHPDVVKLYYDQYRDLVETVFAPEDFDPLVEQLLGDWVSASEIDGLRGIKQFVVERAASILYGGYPGAASEPQIPQQFTIAGPEEASGYVYARRDVVDLSGTANAIETRSVLVNGQPVPDSRWSQRNGTWSADNIGLDPGINRIVVQTFAGPNGTSSELMRGYTDVWYDDGDMAGISGTLAADTTLDASSGPWHVASSIFVPSGVTLTIEAGATLFFDAGAGISVQQGGRLVAEGTEYRRIRLTRVPASDSRWDGLTFLDTMEDNRLCCVDMEFGDNQNQTINVERSRVLIDSVSWNSTDKNVLELEHPSVIIRNCVFPDLVGDEAIYGYGLSGDEYLIIERSTFGKLTGYNDAIDFSDCRRPGPILQLYDNVFHGGEDDALDLDDCDAHVEGNVFMHFLGGATGTSNGIATDAGSQVTVARNVFFDNDSAMLLKGDSELIAQNNVFVGHNSSVVNFRESAGTTPGKAAYLNGNICWDNGSLLLNFDAQTMEVSIDYSILPAEWHDFGQGNIDADPVLVDADGDFHLMPSSPAIGTGPCGLDMGAYVPAGAAICGEPYETTRETAATLTVGGPGITSYKYNLNDPDGPYSEERSVAIPIELTGLSNGQSYTVYAIGKNSAGIWQSQTNATASRTWTVDTSYSRLVINEVLAHTHGADPDLIELYYDGPAPLSLSGMSLTDDPGDPRKFILSSNTVSSVIMNPGDYMVLYGDLDTQLKDHLGFGLYSEGEGLYLYDKPAAGGGLLDSVVFGPQLNGFTIGRVGYDRGWKLNKPTLGGANIAQPLGDPRTLKINEWLARGEVLFADDFIELYNPAGQPVDLSGLYLTDNPVTQPAKQQLGPLSFIDPCGYAVFVADGTDAPGHLDFRLSSDRELIGLFDGDLKEIDKVIYGPQTTDVSQGRSPDGSSSLKFFELPTPGVGNPAVATPTTTVITLAREDAAKRAIVPLSADHIDQSWNSDPGFDDSAWLSVTGAPGGVGYERGSGYEDMISLDVESQMYGEYTSCYVRIPFTVDANDVSDFTGLTLKVRYDDGFVAYINGVEVDRANFTGQPQWDSDSDGNHEAGSTGFDLERDIFDRIDALQQGDNVLAIHALNTSRTSSDFLISAALEGSITEWDDGEPSFANEMALLEGLRITELMYHAADGSNYDYVELQNVGDMTLDLTGVRFIDGIEFVFPATLLGPGEYVVVAANESAFRSRYGIGVNVAGQYLGSLDNGGEDVVLILPWPLEAAVLRFSYDDGWYPTTDGGGDSLEIIDPTADPASWDQRESWQAASPTPGQP